MIAALTRLALCAALPVALSACSAGLPRNSAEDSGTQVQGSIIYPPQAGQATFDADIGVGQPVSVVSFGVGTDGQYALDLPVPSRLAAAGQYDILPTLPDLALLGFTRGTCTGQAALTRSTSGARLAVISSGQFVVGGVSVAQILPSSYATGGVEAQNLTSTKRFYAYADRAVRVAGNLACTFIRSGAAVSGQVKVDYRLAQGWNVLTLQMLQSTQPASVLLNATVDMPAVPVQWRYYPTQ